LAVLTIPNLAPGAAVAIDGTPVAPEEIETGVRVTAGRHVVLATAEGYEPAEREIVAEPGANLRVEMPLARLLPLPVLRVVGSEGAALSIDGEHVGELPWEGSVEPGDRLLAIEGEGLHRWEGTVGTRRGDVHEVRAELGRLPSGPDPAWIWTAVGLAAAAGAASLGFGIASLEANDDFDLQAEKIQAREYGSPVDLDARQARGREAAADAEQWALGCDVSWGIAAAGAAAALVLLLLYDGGDGGPSVTFSSGGETAIAAGWRW
ncbi:MAG: PEGA domain-containing protein, partial [Myxococcota bacterium]|nr:PEGA domain-containing protein [Myxococcota bacterium]